PPELSASTLVLSLPTLSSAVHSFPTRRSSDLVAELSGQGQHPLLPLPDRGSHALLAFGHAGFECEHGDGRGRAQLHLPFRLVALDRKSTRLNSSHVKISYAVSCSQKKKGRQTP